jgi:hypothetical protein
MNKTPLRRYLQRNQVAFLDTQSEINGHCFRDGAVQIVAASDLCFTSLQLSRGNAEKLRDILDKLLGRALVPARADVPDAGGCRLRRRRKRPDAA